MRITISSEIEKIVQSVRVEFGDKAELFRPIVLPIGTHWMAQNSRQQRLPGCMYSYTMNSVA